MLFRDSKKRRNPVYILLLTFFALNIFDYCLLSFEFSMGVEQRFPYSQTSCTVYQVCSCIKNISDLKLPLFFFLYNVT